MAERSDTTYSVGVKYHPTAANNTKTKTINYINLPDRDQQTAQTLDPFYNLMIAINTSIIGGIDPEVKIGEESNLIAGGE